MLGSSYDVETLKHKREIGQATATNPYSEVDCSLFMELMMVLTSERLEKC
jgi:hypothetical protein